MIKLISHRGNIESINPYLENTQSYIQSAIDLGYDVEIDVRRIDCDLFLGHDTPDQRAPLDWLLERKNNLWIHAKNFQALSYLINCDLRVFYHQKENHTIINNCNLIWSHELSEADKNSIIPLLSVNDLMNFNFITTDVYGICSDFVSMLKDKCLIK